ncbi:MAG: hypothetical protein JW712_10300 [Dehalococcoidales bacterium]|nr:hypothetical protein [Dehalococcoidales bacterium]
MSHQQGSHKAPTTSSAIRETKVQCDAFKRNEDGTWISTKITDFPCPAGTVRINPGILFRPGNIQWGVEVVKALEENCSIQ